MHRLPAVRGRCEAACRSSYGRNPQESRDPQGGKESASRRLHALAFSLAEAPFRGTGASLGLPIRSTSSRANVGGGRPVLGG